MNVTNLERAEQRVEEQSASLKKPLGLFDLALTQILFVVGSSWVGAAAKLGQAHLFFWLLAITVIALGGMFVITNISYAIGESAAWMPNNKWCVSLISCALVAGLG